MEAGRALGLWRSTFGAVKIEADNSKGGIQSGAVQGVWQYQRQGQDVVGYFFGTLRGNVFQFRWQEPANPPLTGEGYLVFEQTGRQYSGRWWSDKRDRVGDWNGWRQAGQQQQIRAGSVRRAAAGWLSAAAAAALSAAAAAAVSAAAAAAVSATAAVSSNSSRTAAAAAAVSASSSTRSSNRRSSRTRSSNRRSSIRRSSRSNSRSRSSRATISAR